MGLSLANRVHQIARRSLLPLVLILAAVVAAFAGENGFLALRYERLPIAAGEYWRLLTGHVAHLGWPHLLLNLGGLVLIWALVGDRFGTRAWLLVTAVCVAFMDAGFWYLMPALGWYVGLSGLLHGLFAAGIAGGLVAGRQRRGEAAVLAILLVAKLGWEAWQGAMPGSVATAGGNVVTESHLLGAIGGAATGLLLALYARHRERIRVGNGASI